MTWSAGDARELMLCGLTHDGRAVARPGDGPVVFVRGGLPGQRILARLTTVKKRMAEARLLEVLARAADERPAPCPHAEACGGCAWQTLPYPAQLVWKRRLLTDALTRIGGIKEADALTRPTLPSPANAFGPGEWQYRNKMEFAFAPGPDGLPRLGLRRRASHEVVEVDACLLQTDRTMRILAALRRLVPAHGLPARHPENPDAAALRFAVIREPATDPSACVVELITGPAVNAPAVAGLGRALLSGPWGVSGFIHSTRAAPSDLAYGEKTVLALGRAALAESLRVDGHAAPLRFALGHGAFFQVNTPATELLYSSAVKLAAGYGGIPGDRGGACWDLYCGVGGLALSFAPYFHTVLGLESVPAAVALARRNAAAFSHCRFECADASRVGEYFRRFGTPNLVSADPPRAGLDPRVTRALVRARPAALLMVSCNPATLARDVAALSPAYELKAVQPVDLFPQTPHVESAAFLCLRQ
ncbi:MAG: 23S rRNA (uracil(1939)-C(5))-methyltransferase RlmD [Desulfovibrionaceae bacterium]|nr:23S rRNA (uracil(1939)-C(5))-methyltransferase RlmD [Desulfovibrionaceae bacterium]